MMFQNHVILMYCFGIISLQTVFAQMVRRSNIIASEECKVYGYEEKASIVGCEERILQMNVCAGKCLSYTVPFLNQPFKTIAKCCRMVEFEDVLVVLNCVENGEPKKAAFNMRSAVRCECSDCEFHLD